MLLHGFLLAIPLYGPISQPSPTTPPGMRIPTAANEALILNSGSTNTAGYRLRVMTDGSTTLQQGDIPLQRRVPQYLVQRFFADLQASGPLDQIRSHICMKSASFGTTMQIVYRGKTSPDIACPGTARKLESDALAIADAAGVSIVPRPIDR
jgi:predicted GNAT family acetyltransferase